ncbi:zinc finger protein 385B [Procambarus clarkii]|uniref:zinc finger protein 385B n=1 Tax=Procambarus clarkii TaxID=6728 RepID=UPI003743ABD4
MVPYTMADTTAPSSWIVASPAVSTSASLLPQFPAAFSPYNIFTTLNCCDREGALIGGSAATACKPTELVLGDVLGLGLQVLDFTMSYMPTSVPYMPFPAPSPTHQPSMLNMSGGVPSSNSAIMASVEMADDPVAKAVMENALGRMPPKKPRVTVRCEVCNLEFSSQTVLDSHSAGSKHQRKVKSADLLRTLEETEKGFERDDVSGVIRCVVCDVTVNSPQLLATHIAGNKHKQRAAKRASGSSDPPPKRPCTTAPGVTGCSNGGTGTPSEPSSSNIDIPECVTKLEDTKGGGKIPVQPLPGALQF